MKANENINIKQGERAMIRENAAKIENTRMGGMETIYQWIKEDGQEMVITVHSEMDAYKTAYLHRDKKLEVKYTHGGEWVVTVKR